MSPTKLAKYLELLGRWADYQGNKHLPPQQHAHQAHRPKPGDLVSEKFGMSSLRPDYRADAALILWRMLDTANFADQELIRCFYERVEHNDRVDCLVALIQQDGGTFYMPVDIKKLRRLDQSELAELVPYLDGKTPGAVGADALEEA